MYTGVKYKIIKTGIVTTPLGIGAIAGISIDGH